MGVNVKVCDPVLTGKNNIGDGRKSLGLAGEMFAAELLRLQGYRILERNYRCRYAEIDIICERECLVFVEVKTRCSDYMGAPCDAVDENKRKRIRRAAQYYLMNHPGLVEQIGFQVIEIRVNQIDDLFL